MPWCWLMVLLMALCGSLSAASLDPIPDLTLEEDAPPSDIQLTFDPSPLPASAYRFEASSSDSRVLLPPGALSVAGQAPHPVLRVFPAPDAFGEAVITVRAVAEGADPVSQSFRLQVLPVNDPPRIQPIPNQVLVEGMPTVRIPLEASDPDGRVQLISAASDAGRNLRVAIVGSGANRLLDLTPLARNLTAPVRVSVTLTAISGADRSSLSFFVVIQPREFSIVGSAFGGQTPSTATPLPVQTSPRFVWSDVNGDGYPDLSSHGLSGVRWTSPQGAGGNLSLTPFGRGGGEQVGLNALVWGDVNGNGDLEAFAAGRGVFGTYRLSRPAIRSPLIQFTNDLARMSVEGAAWADLDGNGSLDLVYTGVTNLVRQVVLALNDGLGNLTMVPHTLPSVAGPVVAADFDQDGRNDLLLCSNSQSPALARLFFNRGRMVFTEGPAMTGAGGTDVDGDGIPDIWPPVTGAGTADVDGDGVPDLWFVQAVDGNRRALELHVLRQRAGRFTRSFHLNTNDFLMAAEPAWGDLDHDGRVDFVAPYRGRVVLPNGSESTTNYFAVYHNRGEGRFERGEYLFRVPVTAPSLLPSFVPAVADVDQDGDLDILGFEEGYRAFYNLRREPNIPPDAPSGLRSLVVGDEVFLFWSPATDANQTAPLTYNVRVGASPGTNDLVASQSLTNGVRQLAAAGNAGFLHTYSFRLPRRDIARIHWAVQAVDASFSGGPFAPEQSFDLDLTGNQPPQIEAPAEVTVLEDTPLTLDVGIADDRTPPEVLTLRVEVQPSELLNAAWLRLPPNAPPGTKRRLILSPRPDATGVATVTLQATDRNGATASHEIRVTIVPENDRPGINAEIPRVGLRNRPIRGTLSVFDAESAPEALTLSASSSSPGILPDSEIRITGTGGLREFVATPVGDAVGATEVTLTVTDADGLTASTQVMLSWQERLLEVSPLAENIPSMTTALVLDVDGDGLPDLVGAEAAVPGVVSVWLQSPVGVWIPGSRLSTGLLPGALLPGDFDGDGDVDLVVNAVLGSIGSGGLTVSLLWNDAGRFERGTPLLLNQGLLKLAVMDVDADGDLDLVGGTSGTEIRLWRHPGAAPDAAAPQHWEALPLERPQAISLGLQGDSFLEVLLPADVNQDGRMDLLLSRTGEPSSARGLILLQKDSGSFSVERPPWSPQSMPLDVADFDNDGIPDTLLRYPPELPPSDRVLVGRSRWVEIGYLASRRALGDLDGDGMEDVLGTIAGNRGYGLLSALASEAPRFTPQLEVNFHPDSLMPADLDSNGHLDLLGLQDGRVVQIHNLGAPSNQPPAIPSGLQVLRIESGEVELVWTPPQDAEQSGGLSYNVRVGTSPGAGDVVSALATSAGRALLPGRGNAGGRGRFRLRGLTLGSTYHWSVQAVDTGLARSAFAAEATLKLTALPEISAIADMSLPLSAGEQSVAFNVSDLETPASALHVEVTSSNPVLLSSSRLGLSGDGGARTLRLLPKPDRAGTADITVRVTDSEQLVAERRFTVFVPSPSGYAVTTNWVVALASGDSVDLALNGFDPEGDFLEYQAGSPRHGTVSGDGPRITYQAAPGYIGADSIEYLATTPGSWPARGVITFQIEPAYRFRPEVRLTSFGIPARWQLVFRARAGSRVGLEQSRDLRTWEPLGEHLVPANEMLLVPSPDLAEDAPRFFRLVSLPH